MLSKVIALVVAFVIALPFAASANCLTQSQNAIAAVQAMNAYSISRYTVTGDPQYDQVLPICSKTVIREVSCNVAFNVALRLAEDTAERDTDEHTRKFVCLVNYLGSVAFGLYIRKAIGVQIFHARF